MPFRGSCGLRRTCEEHVSKAFGDIESVGTHKYTPQRRGDLPEEEVLPICDIEVARILLDVWVAELGGAEPETVIRECIELDLFI